MCIRDRCYRVVGRSDQDDIGTGANTADVGLAVKQLRLVSAAFPSQRKGLPGTARTHDANGETRQS